MSDPAKLARMANQIAAFFRAYPQEQAVAGVHDHIAAFWSPRMRADLARTLDGDAAAALDPLVVAALRRPARAQPPTAREAAGPDAVGELASDAG